MLLQCAHLLYFGVSVWSSQRPLHCENSNTLHSTGDRDTARLMHTNKSGLLRETLCIRRSSVTSQTMWNLVGMDGFAPPSPPNFLANGTSLLFTGPCLLSTITMFNLQGVHNLMFQKYCLDGLIFLLVLKGNSFVVTNTRKKRGNTVQWW